MADGRYSRSSHDIDFDDNIQGMNIGDGMISLVPASSERPKPVWTSTMDQYFVKLMLDQVRKGNKISNKFNKQAWTHMLAFFNSKFCSKHSKRVLRQRHKKLRKYYTDIKYLLEHDGFSWDERHQKITAGDDVWNNYMKAYPNAQLYRKKTLLNHQDLDMIYGNTIVNGYHSHLCQYKDHRDDILQRKAGQQEWSQTRAISDSLKICWTVAMDCYLIDLLLDQALKGNQVGHEFTVEAWIEIATLFNTRFGCLYDKDALNYRVKQLRRQYNDIKILLGQSGFSYDDTREMVIAEDYIWDFYTKAHPEAYSYKNKFLPSYHKLCVIYGEENSEGGYDHNVNHDGEGPVLMCNSKHLRKAWTFPMERYFVDLMLEQVVKGNSLGQTFNEEAWNDMEVLFKERFGEDSGDILRGRHKRLRKLYNDMKNLPDKSDYFCDDIQLMVTTYDLEDPDIVSSPMETNPNYDDLCLIYGKPSSNGDSKKIDSSPGWTPPMDRYFIDVMLEQIRKGSMVNHEFQKQAWSAMISKFNATFGWRHGKEVFKSRFKYLRKHFNDMKMLLEQDGFVWDEMQQMIAAADDLWDACIKENPDMQYYRRRTLPHYNDLFLIYGNPNNNEMSRSSSNSITFEDGCACRWSNVDEDDPSLAFSDPLMVDWTKLMDRYFIDLMLDQVHRGDKTGHTFSLQAWTFMTTSFNKKFGLNYEKYVLENRYLSLMKVYRDINNLLSQSGFAWDETKQRAIANVNVWEAYIKEHPDAITFRDRSLGWYDDLCIIAHHGILNGSSSHSDLGPENTYNALDIEMDEIYGLLQSPLDFEIPYLGKRRQSASFSSGQYPRKVQRTSKNRMHEFPSVQAKIGCVASTSANYRESESHNSIEAVVHALQTIPDLDDELFFDACELLEDEKRAAAFVALDVTKRKKWLLTKLRS